MSLDHEFFTERGRNCIFAPMKFIYIQILKITKKIEIPYRITIGNGAGSVAPIFFLVRPELSVSKRKYEEYKLDRMELLAAPPFCDSADELIEIFQDETLVFSERKQFSLLKSQFKTIGYNFEARPKILWNPRKNGSAESLESTFENTLGKHLHSAQFAERFVEYMHSLVKGTFPETEKTKPDASEILLPDLSSFKSTPGVYYFLDASDEVVYVGKAKSIRKRLGSHFANRDDASNIDYTLIRNIHVEYTGNDMIAQLIESDRIKNLKPVFNTQQVSDAAPYIINKDETAKGIYRLKITRKDIKDNMPERYFNRLSVKQSLEEFCTRFQLCRKHCGLENVKGPCSNVTVRHQECVCAGSESIEAYNSRFAEAFTIFQKRKSRKVYKLKGRSGDEDAFVYTVNGIYEGYGFIDKDETIATENDLLGYLLPMRSNYDTARIISDLPKTVLKENILVLE